MFSAPNLSRCGNVIRYPQYGDVGFTFFLSKLEVDALEKGGTCILGIPCQTEKKAIHFFGGWETSELIPLRW